MRLIIVATLAIRKANTLNGRLMMYNNPLPSFALGFIPKMMVINASISMPIINQTNSQNMIIYIVSTLFPPLGV